MKTIFLLVLFITPAFAQPQPPPSPDVQALQSRVMQEINANLQCSSAAIALQQENAKLKAELEKFKKPADAK